MKDNTSSHTAVLTVMTQEKCLVKSLNGKKIITLLITTEFNNL